MIRAAILSIVLTLATGPSVARFCAVWCQPAQDRASSCDHQDNSTAPRLAAVDNCAPLAVATTALNRGDTRREVLTDTLQTLGAVPRFHVAPSSTGSVAAAARRIDVPGHTRPTLIALLI